MQFVTIDIDRYIGALEGIEDELFHEESDGENNENMSLLIKHQIFNGVTGCSSGAIAAALIGLGIQIQKASEFVSSLKLNDIQDFFGFGSLMRGDRLESIIDEFIIMSSPITVDIRSSSNVSDGATQLHLEQTIIPVSVSTTNIVPVVDERPSFTSWINPLSPKILQTGPISRAIRASSSFPFLFEPVGWIDREADQYEGTNQEKIKFSLLIDGGFFDWSGYNGLKEIVSRSKELSTYTDKNAKKKSSKVHLLNMIIGGFGGPIKSKPDGPKQISKNTGVHVDSVLSLSITNLPSCGPFKMGNGPFAIKAARNAIKSAMDRPIISDIGEPNHYIVEIDASSFSKFT